MSKWTDPNTEIFQCRAQWKKVEICRQMWAKRWSWLLEERAKTAAESEAIRKQSKTLMSKIKHKSLPKKSLKPIPETTNQVYGWLGSRPDCQLEIYTSWISKIPIKLPDAWEVDKEYGLKKK